MLSQLSKKSQVFHSTFQHQSGLKKWIISSQHCRLHFISTVHIFFLNGYYDFEYLQNFFLKAANGSYIFFSQTWLSNFFFLFIQRHCSIPSSNHKTNPFKECRAHEKYIKESSYITHIYEEELLKI